MRNALLLRVSPLLIVLAFASVAAAPGVTTQLSPADATVLVFNFGYEDTSSDSPVTTVSAGSTVAFVWSSGVHTVTHATGTDADLVGPPVAGVFDSGVRATPQRDPFLVSFPDPGTFAYYCTIHPAMRGVVVVT